MRCSATTQAGTPCRAAACSGSDRCVQHSADPALVARRTDGARRGGTRPRLATDAPSRSAAPVETDDLDLESPAGLRTLLARVMARVADRKSVV